jgi:hypothetical protein
MYLCALGVHLLLKMLLLVSGGNESGGNDSGEIDFKRINQEAVSEFIFLYFLLHIIVQALRV